MVATNVLFDQVFLEVSTEGYFGVGHHFNAPACGDGDALWMIFLPVVSGGAPRITSFDMKTKLVWCVICASPRLVDSGDLLWKEDPLRP